MSRNLSSRSHLALSPSTAAEQALQVEDLRQRLVAELLRLAVRFPLAGQRRLGCSRPDGDSGRHQLPLVGAPALQLPSGLLGGGAVLLGGGGGRRSGNVGKIPRVKPARRAARRTVGVKLVLAVGVELVLPGVELVLTGVELVLTGVELVLGSAELVLTVVKLTLVVGIEATGLVGVDASLEAGAVG